CGGRVMITLREPSADLQGRSPEEVLEWAYRSFRRVAIVASFQAESSVLIHMAAAVTDHPEVVTLDTGRLPAETHAVVGRLRRRARRHRQGGAAGRLDAGRALVIQPRAPARVSRPLRPRLQLDRLRALHQGDQARRGREGRPLVVGGVRSQRVWPALGPEWAG